MSILLKNENLLPKVTLKYHGNSQNMNIKYGIPVLFICCGFFVICINFLGDRSNLYFKRPKLLYRNDYKKLGKTVNYKKHNRKNL